MRELLQRIRGLIGVGQVGIVDDSKDQQLVQLKIGQGAPDQLQEIIDKLVRISEYGFASRPPKDAQAVAIFLGGNRSTGLIIATGDQATRLKDLLEGEAALYNGVRNTFFKMGDDGKAYLNCDLVVDGNIIASQDILDRTADDNEATVKNLRDAYDAHKHTGVQAGAASTGPTDHEV